MTLGWSWFYLAIVLALALLSRFQPRPVFLATLSTAGWYYVISAIYLRDVIEFETVYAAAAFGALHTWLYTRTASNLFLWLAAGNLIVIGLTLTHTDPYIYKLARNIVFLGQVGGIAVTWISLRKS